MNITQIIRRKQDLRTGVVMTRMPTLFATGDAQAHRVEIELYEGETPAVLSAQQVKGYFIRADNGTLELDEDASVYGTIDGNVAAVTLDEKCYAQDGGFQLIVKLIDGEKKRAIFWGVGTVTKSSTGIAVTDGGSGGTGGGATPPASGEDGEDGGYYTPIVTQPEAGTMRIEFEPSKGGMPAVTTVEIALPKGEDGKDGKDGANGTDYVLTEADKQAIADLVAAKNPVKTVFGQTPNASGDVTPDNITISGTLTANKVIGAVYA